MTWDEANTHCSNRRETLIDFTDVEDLKYVKNKLSTSHSGIWIGLKKNASNLTEILANDLFKVGLRCVSSNITGYSVKNDSCSKYIPSPLCVKTPGETPKIRQGSYF